MTGLIDSEHQPLNTLTVELQAELGFEYDANHEWLFSDHFASVGSGDIYEFLPAKVRISADGTRYQIGARRVDIEGLLKLARLINPQSQGIDTVINFWNGRGEVKTTADDEFIYMEIGIEPTAEGLEKKYDVLGGAWYTALSAAVKNLTFEQMQKDRWFGVSIRNVLGDTEGNTMQSRRVIFGRSLIESFEDRESELDEMPAETFRRDTDSMAPNLREYPIGFDIFGLDKMPGSLKYRGIERKSDELSLGTRIQVYHDPSGHFAEINNYLHNYNFETREWERDNSLRLKLLAPEGTELDTVDDLRRVKKARLVDNEYKTETEYDVTVAVDDHSLHIESSDGELVIVLGEPGCFECKTPLWKFPHQRYVEKTKGIDFKTINNHVSGHDQNGLDRYFFSEQEGQRAKVYCADCIPQKVEDYLLTHPYAHEATARGIIRKRLDDAGYGDVQIWRDMLSHTEGKWVGEAVIHYERDGRQITRCPGRFALTDDGKFEPELISPEAANFRA
ncbi:MAG: hypothetical protein Q7S45_03200 [Candidatus Curtissbacteria bacterium]|nr:hypothetical protein [Candidatus Curtissbacteria bacterium]